MLGGWLCELARLALTSTTNWVTYTKEIYCLTVLEVRRQKLRCQQNWFLQKAVRDGSVPRLSPWLVDDNLLSLYFYMVFLL